MKENISAELVANGVNILNHWGEQLCRICISPSLNLSLLRCYRDRCYCSYRVYPPWIRLALSHASYRYRPSICPNTYRSIGRALCGSKHTHGMPNMPRFWVGLMISSFLPLARKSALRPWNELLLNMSRMFLLTVKVKHPLVLLSS